MPIVEAAARGAARPTLTLVDATVTIASVGSADGFKSLGDDDLVAPAYDAEYVALAQILASCVNYDVS